MTNEKKEIKKYISEKTKEGGRLVKCNCLYSWITKSELNTVTCPNCASKIRIETPKKKASLSYTKCGSCGIRIPKIKELELYEKNLYENENRYRCKKHYKEIKDHNSREIMKGLKEIGI